MKKLLFYIIGLLFFASCEKEDTAIVLPPPGDLKLSVANMGSNYDNQVYFDFETGFQKSVPYRSYDLAFEASADGFRVYLNTGKFMFIANTFSTDIQTADSTGKEWKTETDHLYDDSTAFGNWLDGTSMSKNEIYIIDRGRAEHFGSARWRKIQLVAVDNNQYRIRYSLYNNTLLSEFTIPKNSAYSLMYFSFDDGGKMVEVAPEKELWDVVFTKFTHTYYSEPVNSPYRYYIVTGGLLNRWAANENEIVKQDSTPGYKTFEQVKAADISAFNFHKDAALIGFSWKEYDFNLGYIIYTDRFYMLHDNKGYYYKIRFLDFYDSQGNKGAASFEYQRL
ncbi:MAG: hypothetical protein IPP71_06950 [Bacteroidetes bacterium]|nr:hypothetical protein [Bacteroidota bacterium]